MSWGEGVPLSKEAELRSGFLAQEAENTQSGLDCEGGFLAAQCSSPGSQVLKGRGLSFLPPASPGVVSSLSQWPQEQHLPTISFVIALPAWEHFLGRVGVLELSLGDRIGEGDYNAPRRGE